MPIYAAAITLGKPPAPHTMTDAAEAARQAVRDHAARRDAERAAPPLAEPSPLEARMLPLGELTGSPAGFAKAPGLVAVCATIAADGSRLSVWGTSRGRRVRAMYRRTATGWGTDGVLIDGALYGVTAALAELGE